MNDVALQCIGTELLDGSTRDLNMKFLGQFLDEYNIKLKKAVFCSDSFEHISEFLDFEGLLIISGGLGPTLDDITKSVLSTHFKEDIEKNPAALEICQKQFSEKNKDYDLKQYHYHMLPTNFEPLYNEVGYAPGLISKKHNIIALPGVPREFQAMIKAHLPSLLKSKTFTQKLVFRTRGIIEVKIFRTLDPTLWENLSQYGEVSSLPVEDGVNLGVRLSANSAKELKQLQTKVEAVIKSSKVSQYIWSTGANIQEKVHQYLTQLGQSLSLAESCTGGLISSLLTNQPGSSKYLIGSIVAYQNEVKVNQLGIDPELIEKFGVVSQEVSELMALKAREKFHSNYSIATTGHLEFINGKAPHIWISIASEEGVISKSFQFYKDRKSAKKLFAKASLHLLRSVLLEYKGLEIGNAY